MQHLNSSSMCRKHVIQLKMSNGIIENRTQLRIHLFVDRLSVAQSICLNLHRKFKQRVRGIEPPSQAWEAHILPLDHTRVYKDIV